VRGVVLENGQRIAAPVVISGADAHQTFDELVGTHELPRRFAQSVRSMKHSLSAFVVYGATDLDLRAAGAAHEMFAYRVWDHDEDYANLLRGEITRVGITVPTLADSSLAPAGEHLFQLTVLLPYDVVPSWRVEKNRYTDLLLAEAELYLPGLRDHLRFAEGASPRTFERYTRNHAGAMYGWDVSPDQTGPLRLEQETPIKGLHLAGHWTQPGSGVYGVIASGVRAAQRALGLANEQEMLTSSGGNWSGISSQTQ
jgi:prolycopene isomerase